MLEKEVLTPQEVAEYLQLTPETVYRYIRQGKLAASRIGRYYRVRRANVELFLMATSIVGDATLRRFSAKRVADWLREASPPRQPSRYSLKPCAPSGTAFHKKH